MDTTTNTIEISDPKVLAVKPLVSVYMPAYRHEKFIADAIEGVIGQSCNFPIELIVGEDCSPDNTRKIATDYQRRYPHLIRILTAERNVGWKANAYRSIEATRGEYVAICEGDDYWHNPKKLEIQVQQFIETPPAQLVHTDYDRRIGNRVLRNANKQRRNERPAQDNAFVALLHHMTVVSATAMYRRQLLMDYLQSGVESGRWPFGDYPKVLYAALHGPVIYIPISTATYRLVEGSAMNQGRLKSLQMQQAGLECREVFMELAHWSENQKLDIRANSHRTIMRHAALIGDSRTYNRGYEWLVSNNFPPNRIKHFIALTLIRYPLLLKAYRILAGKWRKLIFLVHSEPVR